MILTNVDVLFDSVNDFDVREGCSRPILSTQCTYTSRAVCQKVVYLLFKLRQCLKYCLSVNWYARSMFKFKPCLTILKHPQKVRHPRGYV